MYVSYYTVHIVYVTTNLFTCFFGIVAILLLTLMAYVLTMMTMTNERIKLLVSATEPQSTFSPYGNKDVSITISTMVDSII